MTTASARVMLDNRTVGTAWRFHDRYALTAAHCLGDTHQLQALPELVHIQFPGVAPLRARTRAKPGLDAALLEVLDPVPAGIPALALARPPREPMLSSYAWRGIAYPLVSDFRQLILTGMIRGYVQLDGGLAIQISFNDVVNRRVDSDQTLLSYASGAAVTYQERAIGIVRASLEDTQIGHAVPIDRVASVFPEVGAQLRDYPIATGGLRWREIDRETQWDKVVAAVAQPESRTLLLPGAASECHKTFVARLESFLAGSPPHGRYLDVRWPDVSWTPPDFIAAISVACDEPDDGDEARLAAALARITASEKLVVVHELLDPEKHADDLDTVVAYYRDVLPRLEAAAGHGILWVQPIEWTRPAGAARARALIGKLERRQRPRIEALQELTPMTAEHLETFGAPPAVMAQWARHPTTREAYRLLKDSTTGGSHGR
jgi:hypothetical protein